MNSIIENRLNEFKRELRARNISYLVRRYTTFDRPYAIDDSLYFDLKSDIADHFRIHPSEIVMVGSGKLGFSIKPDRRFMAFGEESDIDMAIISPALFDRIWLEVLEYSESGDFWYYKTKLKFQDYLFQGWIRPDKLPPSKSFQVASQWWEFFEGLTHLYQTYKITGGLYKSWYHFELYQSRAVNTCKQNMELES